MCIVSRRALPGLILKVYQISGIELYSLERILTMVYVIRSYWVCFGLYP
jgi:hypothetical protein